MMVVITVTGVQGMRMDTLGMLWWVWLVVFLNILQTGFFCWARPPTQGVRNSEGSPQQLTHGAIEVETSS